MCKKWYQLITCAEPVGALNRRSFFIPKSPAPNHGCGPSLLLVLIILQVSAGGRTFSAGFLQVAGQKWRQINVFSAGFLQVADQKCVRLVSV